ncbi:restriction endonuclease [Georgenia faecalis]|uniref:Restriction endonuclease n=1 Tax=Georgenia faecalis TaxID=2483799 RepID=A0ABV9DB64_9MICO|nr:restriction endonuclease [Georgenia faecalis]
MDAGVLPLLLWRTSQLYAAVHDEDETPERLPNVIVNICPWCAAKTVVTVLSEREFEFLGNDTRRAACPLCGWFAKVDLYVDGESCEKFAPWEETLTVAELRHFDYASSEVASSELAGYIRTNPRALDSLPARRFEQFTADLLADHGYEVALTQHSRDGGVDVFAVDSLNSAPILVQCKHSPKGRTIGVSALRELAGVSIHFETRRVMLVTNSVFSVPLAQEAASYRRHGFEVNLADGGSLLRMLNVYQPELPDLQVLTSVDLEAIARTNTSLMSRND